MLTSCKSSLALQHIKYLFDALAALFKLGKKDVFIISSEKGVVNYCKSGFGKHIDPIRRFGLL